MLSSANFHKDFKSFNISTHEVGVLGLLFEREISSEALSALINEPGKGIFSWTAKAPVSVRFALEQESGQAFRLQLKGSLALFSACSKCLSDLEHQIDLDLTMRLLEQEVVDDVSSGLDLAFDSDSAQDENESVVGYFTKMSIDLALILREQIFLTVPDYPQCGGVLAVVKEACGPGSFLTSPDDGRARENPFIKLLRKP